MSSTCALRVCLPVRARTQEMTTVLYGRDAPHTVSSHFDARDLFDETVLEFLFLLVAYINKQRLNCAYA